MPRALVIKSGSWTKVEDGIDPSLGQQATEAGLVRILVKPNGQRVVRNSGLPAHCNRHWFSSVSLEIHTKDGEYLHRETMAKMEENLNLKPKDEKDFFQIQNAELQNGRLAMLAAAGFMAQELVDGKGIIEHFTS